MILLWSIVLLVLLCGMLVLSKPSLRITRFSCLLWALSCVSDLLLFSFLLSLVSEHHVLSHYSDACINPYARNFCSHTSRANFEEALQSTSVWSKRTFLFRLTLNFRYPKSNPICATTTKLTVSTFLIYRQTWQYTLRYLTTEEIFREEFVTEFIYTPYHPLYESMSI